MPEFFFHVALELLPHSEVGEKQSESSSSPWTTGIQLLSPFLKKSPQNATAKSIASRGPSKIDHRRHQTPQTLSAYPHAPPTISSETIPSKLEDQRLDHIYIESTDMNTIRQDPVDVKHSTDGDNHISKGIGTAISGLQTKGRYVSLDQQKAESVWGIVHLYRDTGETPGLYGDSPLSKPTDPWYYGVPKGTMDSQHPPPADQDCTTLCILAVPSYLAPSDFLAFVGEETRNEVTHFRMIRTARTNRYMVLMKFRYGKKAREWQQEWNGKVFNSMEPETCHVVFLKSVELIQSADDTEFTSPPTYPTMNNDPFTTTKPLAPRTPALVELPTCPVCLERMDETTGLLTILCQHVFHCTCLQKWSGGGCPVCRYTHDDFSSRPGFGSTKYKTKKGFDIGGSEMQLECETCHAEANLWQCLICGKMGCGRYAAKHAFAHFEETGHIFAMDMESKRVWDYAGDAYVHRIIQDAGTGVGEKLVELPGTRRNAEQGATALENDEDLEGEKMEGLALEYTHLLTSQLESQRVYFEEKVERAADKASEASAAAAAALEAAGNANDQLQELKIKYDDLARDAVPALEKEKARAEKRADKFEDMARNMEKNHREEEAINGRLMERIEFLTKEFEALKAVRVDLEEQNRDLTFFISSSEKLKDSGEDVQEGTVSVPDPPTGKKRGKGKGRR